MGESPENNPSRLKECDNEQLLACLSYMQFAHFSEYDLMET